jgi:hypothetical protein
MRIHPSLREKYGPTALIAGASDATAQIIQATLYTRIDFLVYNAGYPGSGYLATYAASKTFILILAEGLWYEWRPPL